MQATSPLCWEPGSEADRVMLGLSRVVRQMRQLNDRHGLDFGSVAVLFTVAHHEHGVRISDVAAAIHLDLSTVSRHVRTLEQAGLLAKTADPADGRASLVAITEDGGATLREVMQQRSDVIAAATADWTQEQQRTLADLLHRLSTSLADQLQP